MNGFLIFLVVFFGFAALTIGSGSKQISEGAKVCAARGGVQVKTYDDGFVCIKAEVLK